MGLKAFWFGTGRQAVCAPNPNFPDGITVDVSVGYKPRCGIKLAYPAESVGQWHIHCSDCRASVVVTAAGRIDDPKEVIINCQIEQ